MTIESDIYDDAKQCDEAVSGFHDFMLLRTTAYATLYLAVRSGKRFLVKTTKDKSEWQERLLRREYELSLGMEHANIVHVYSLENIEPYGVAIVMEYIDGRTLSDYLAERPSRKERERLFEELLQTTEYLHKRGVVHNDLKPDNILVSRTSNTLKLIDFGLADSDAEYAMRSLGCTPRYASPELRARKHVDARSDIYSLGVIIEDMFGTSSVSRRATRVQPERRYADIAQLHRVWRRRYMGWVFVVVVVALLFAGIALISTVGSSSHSPESMPTPIEESMEHIYLETTDSISVAKYNEFAVQHVERFIHLSDSLATAAMTTADSEQERDQISTHCEHLKYHYITKLFEQVDTLPSILYLDSEECDFYLRLLMNKEPFREYSAKE